MTIRKIKPDDAAAIAILLQQLGYPGTEKFINGKLAALIADPDEYCVVLENAEKIIIGFISVHIIPQIALEGDFARISYFSVDHQWCSRGAGRRLEEYAEKIARERNCDRIEVHCHERREAAHRFYYRQGFTEAPRYLVKVLK